MRGWMHFCVLAGIVVWVLPQGDRAYAEVVINEVMASNTKTVKDSQGGYDDWIEIYNPSAAAVDLAGFSLTDDPADPNRWTFPKGQPSLTQISAHGYLLVWADGDGPSSELHAGFNLSSEGEQISLFGEDGTLIDQVTLGSQWADVSYGRWTDGSATWQYMAIPTPKAANKQGYDGVVADIQVSPGRGFYDGPITVTLSTESEGAEIWYTLDANVPHQKVTSKGVTTWLGQKYTGPFQVARTTSVRAVAFRTGWKDSAVVSHTYLFLGDVIRQSATPAGFPTRWGRNGRTDYAMDQRVVDDPLYSGEIKADLKSIPSVCVVVPIADLFDSTNGIYANPTQMGVKWEKAASMEWIDPCTGEAFGLNAGLRIHGAQYSRQSNIKKSLRFLFKAQYGPSKLTYPLFPDTDVKTFDTIVLRSIWNFSWTGDSGGNFARADYLRDLYARDTVRDMGHLTPHGRPVCVYINGLYWGLYIMSERADGNFAAAHLGGEPEDYDMVSPSNQDSSIQPIAGDPNITAWKTLFALADQDLNSPEAYRAIQQYVDLPVLIDYMLMIYYTGSRDAPTYLNSDNSPKPRNFFAVRSSNPPGPFRFIPWDTEWILEDPAINRVTLKEGVSNPHLLMIRLANNPDFKVLLADRIHQRFFKGGVLTLESGPQRYQARADEIHGAIVGESARWGDVKKSPAYTRVDWLAEVNRIVNQFLPVRTQTVLGQLRDRGWYPAVEPPVFQINNKDQAGGEAQPGAALGMVNPNASGVIYYTTDGSDPRVAAASQNAVAIMTLLPEASPKRIWVPTEDIGTVWRGANEPFDDSAWTDSVHLSRGTGAVGYDMESEYGPFISEEVFATMFGSNASCYIRMPFDVKAEDRAQLRSMTLRVRCDDGFVAYLNGVEVASINRPSSLAWDSVCAERPNSTEVVEIPISGFLSALRAGANILAVQAMNQAVDDWDFLFSAELIASTATTTDPEISSLAIHYMDPLTLKGSVHVKARVLAGQWSAIEEAVYAVGPVVDGLRVTELMYHAPDPNLEFIELTNVGTQPLSLALVRFTQGISFTFPDMDLTPGQYVLVVADVNAFESAYGKGLPVAGQYTGNLSNGGERVQISDALGRTIADFEYSDSWYKTTDGGGYSLTVKGVQAAVGSLSSSQAWRPSARAGGSPGRGGL